MRYVIHSLIVCSLYLTGCGGGGGSVDEPLIGGANSEEKPLINDPVMIDDPTVNVDAPTGGRSPTVLAVYRVTMENFWSVEDFPQDFPDDAHLSLIGGATHNMAASFWEEGEIVSPGMEDMAETGRISQLLFDEVAPAITNGTADTMIEINEYTDAQVDGVPGVLEFEIEVKPQWPLVTLVTMLGPSPDWFVGVSGQSLFSDDMWETTVVVDLPLYDGGSKAGMTPVMGGTGSIDKEPVRLIAYDEVLGVYVPSDVPQIVARVTFELVEIYKTPTARKFGL